MQLATRSTAPEVGQSLTGTFFQPLSYQLSQVYAIGARHAGVRGSKSPEVRQPGAGRTESREEHAAAGLRGLAAQVLAADIADHRADGRTRNHVGYPMVMPF